MMSTEHINKNRKQQQQQQNKQQLIILFYVEMKQFAQQQYQKFTVTQENIFLKNLKKLCSL